MAKSRQIYLHHPFCSFCRHASGRRSSSCEGYPLYHLQIQPLAFNGEPFGDGNTLLICPRCVKALKKELKHLPVSLPPRLKKKGTK